MTPTDTPSNRALHLAQQMARQCHACPSRHSTRCDTCWCHQAHAITRDHAARTDALFGGIGHSAAPLHALRHLIATAFRLRIPRREALTAIATANATTTRAATTQLQKLIRTNHLALDAQDGHIRLTPLGHDKGTQP